MDADARRDQSGSILTQLTDVENEDDGLLTLRPLEPEGVGT